MELKTRQHPGAGLQVYLFIGVRWALGPRLTGMISETRPVKHCPTYLKLSSHGRTVDHCTYYWESCFEQCKGYFCPVRETSCVLCVMKHGQRVARSRGHVMASPTSHCLPEILRQALCPPVIGSLKHKSLSVEEPCSKPAALSVLCPVLA